VTAVRAAENARPTELRELLAAGEGGRAVSDLLDALAPDERRAQVLALRGAEVGRLYRAVAGGRTLALDDFVPASAANEETSIFEGRNSLPAFSRFQKRFARIASGQLVGYNHQSLSPLTGPGYFVVRAADDGAVDVPGELYFDYTVAPERAPAGWPAFKPNDRGISRLVYMNMKDYCRHVADGVCVGEAYKLGTSQKAFFVLCRS
jgi:hypothetical protein